MLLNFRMSNHRSVREEQELQLHPAYDADRPVGTDWAAVPVAGLFGANAAGKSNLVGALGYMARMVLNSHRDAEPGAGIARSAFRLDASAADEPSWYVADLSLDGVRYTYGFSIDDERVLDEWLYSYPLGKKRKIFERSEGEVNPGDTQARRELELVENITEPNVLFLTMAARSKQKDFRPVYDWFATGLTFSEGRMRLPLGITPGTPGPAWDTPDLLAVLRSADLGIEAPRETVRPWIGHRGRTGVVRMERHWPTGGNRMARQPKPDGRKRPLRDSQLGRRTELRTPRLRLLVVCGAEVTEHAYVQGLKNAARNPAGNSPFNCVGQRPRTARPRFRRTPS